MADIVIDDELTGVFQGGQAPEQVHGAYFNPTGAWGENSVLKRASDTANNMRDRLNALHDLRVNRNPEEEPAVHARKLARLIDETSRSWAGQWDDVKRGLKAEVGRLEGELKTAANLKVNPDYRNAVVGVFSGLNAEQRRATIEQAIAEGDGPTLATLLEAPSLVTGLTAEQRELIKDRAFAKANPNGHALLKQLNGALVRAEAASLAAIDATVRLAQGTERFDRKVEAARALEAKVRSSLPA